MFVGTGLANLALLLGSALAARALGPENFGAIGAMLAVLLILSIAPFALVMVIARDVATAASASETWAAARFRFVNRVAIVATVVGMAVSPGAALALNVPVALVAVTAASIYPLIMLAVPRGTLQGLERFAPFALSFVLEGFVRVAAIGVALVAGGGVVAVGLAPLIATGVALFATFAMARDSLPLSRMRAASALAWDSGLAGVTAMYGGLFALANLDVILAKVRLAPQDAGAYTVAALFGKIVFFLPVAVGAVLVPLVARTRAAGRATLPLLARAAAAVALACLLTTGISVVAPEMVRGVLGGSAYAATDVLLAPYGITMTILAVASVVGSYLVALGRESVGWLFLLAALLQAIGLSLVLPEPMWLIGVSITIAAALAATACIIALRAGRITPPGRAAVPPGPGC